MILAPVVKIELVETDKLPETVRVEGGFGSTGKWNLELTKIETLNKYSPLTGPILILITPFKLFLLTSFKNLHPGITLYKLS